MMIDETFKLFHRYNKLVRRQLVQPLKCELCGFNLVTGLGRDDALVLECFSCDTSKRPGLATIDRVGAVVKEHFVDED